ncbi:2-Hydroxyacid oxidase 1-like [Glandiceps talaboti]
MADRMLCVADYERTFKGNVHPACWSYFTAGSDEEITLKQNNEAFKRLRIRPRMLRDVSSRDLSTALLGQKIDFPIAIAPTAMHSFAHSGAEVDTAKAAKSLNTCMVLSQYSNSSLEEINKAVPNSLRWVNVYLFKNRDVTQDFIKRIEKSNYMGIVITIDNPLLGNLLRAEKGGFHKKFDSGYASGSMKLGNTDKYQKGYGIENIRYGKDAHFDLRDPGATWEYIDWVCSQTSLPIILKGVLTAEDAVLSVQHGASAIIVSNHGGRVLDSAPATIEVLPEIVRAVGDKCEVYLDGGIRTGNDVFKALALGARAVFVGRPILYGLAHSGEEGVRHILEILRGELHRTMAFAGCRTLSDINTSYVVHESHYAKLYTY